MYQTNIEDAAQELGITIGQLMVLIAEYLLDDKLAIPPRVRIALNDASDQDIEDAIDVIMNNVKQ